MSSLAVEGFKNNINNYKGVMLCTRPNENINVAKDRPFISRVDPKGDLGLNPTKKLGPKQTRKFANPILQRHRAWLEEFKNKVRERKEEEVEKEQQDKEKFDRIRGQATINRNRGPELIEQYLGASNVGSGSPDSKVAEQKSQPEYVPQEQPSPVVVKKETQKKKEVGIKPKWAYTEEQLVDEEDKEIDDLLNFTNNLDYDKYINDIEVKNMVSALKNKIDEIKGREDEDWKKKIVDAWNKDERKSVQIARVDIGDDRSDCRSMASDSKSVASERTHKSIQELKTKIENKDKKDWDVLSTTTAKKQASLEERIAKHVADEILRNNTEFRHIHSNASLRKMLEKEAQKHMEETRGIKGPEIVSSKEYFPRKDVRDPNNLPYLHRNPAI